MIEGGGSTTLDWLFFPSYSYSSSSSVSRRPRLAHLTFFIVLYFVSLCAFALLSFVTKQKFNENAAHMWETWFFHLFRET